MSESVSSFLSKHMYCIIIKGIISRLEKSKTSCVEHIVYKCCTCQELYWYDKISNTEDTLEWLHIKKQLQMK